MSQSRLCTAAWTTTRFGAGTIPEAGSTSTSSVIVSQAASPSTTGGRHRHMVFGAVPRDQVRTPWAPLRRDIR